MSGTTPRRLIRAGRGGRGRCTGSRPRDRYPRHTWRRGRRHLSAAPRHPTWMPPSSTCGAPPQVRPLIRRRDSSWFKPSYRAGMRYASAAARRTLASVLQHISARTGGTLMVNTPKRSPLVRGKPAGPSRQGRHGDRGSHQNGIATANRPDPGARPERVRTNCTASRLSSSPAVPADQLPPAGPVRFNVYGAP
jgi:hypothetical protein